MAKKKSLDQLEEDIVKKLINKVSKGEIKVTESEVVGYSCSGPIIVCDFKVEMKKKILMEARVGKHWMFIKFSDKTIRLIRKPEVTQLFELLMAIDEKDTHPHKNLKALNEKLSQ